MKLLIITAVAQFQHEVSRLLKEAKIDSFSSSGIDGYKESTLQLINSGWFVGERGGVRSHLFFSFTEEEKVEKLMQLIKAFNEKLETDNPVKMVVVPIEKYI
ncbi:hypothetical protein FNH22_03560 [Fulvivirga sp. M361]|uniref:hypothetical protein n=1 Tax=Fulvivirga sp. M361 TaxID=2594266 RepID=UPI00117BC1FE|nr:hypothetical protein [Fulvivirga sp. M361]TRX61865.1 hypothetical protein FNH22_03560 [Fulvivirga sp. M361]